jgi:hypothetical protein
MSLSERRTADLGIVEGLFITKTLQEQAKSFMDDTAKVMKGFTSEKWAKRSMSVSGDTLTYSHNINFRFIDMRSRVAKSGYNPGTKKRRKGKAAKKGLPIHNKPIYRHKKYIQRELMFGFTEDVRAIFQQMIDENNVNVK